MYERDAHDAGVVEAGQLAAAGVDDDLDARAGARLQRADAEQRERAVGVAQQRAAGADQRSVEIHIYAPHGDLVWEAVHTTEVKVVLASVATALAVYQLVLAAIGYRKLRPRF